MWIRHHFSQKTIITLSTTLISNFAIRRGWLTLTHFKPRLVDHRSGADRLLERSDKINTIKATTSLYKKKFHTIIRIITYLVDVKHVSNQVTDAT